MLLAKLKGFGVRIGQMAAPVPWLHLNCVAWNQCCTSWEQQNACLMLAALRRKDI